jgi:hypothetical protein
MIDDLRDAVQDCREALGELDAHLSGAKTVPALPAARLLVAVAGFTARLAKLSAGLDAGKPGRPAVEAPGRE